MTRQTLRWLQTTLGIALILAHDLSVRFALDTLQREDQRRWCRARGLRHQHRYSRGRTDIRFTWESIRLSLASEQLGSDRFALGLTS